MIQPGCVGVCNNLISSENWKHQEDPKPHPPLSTRCSITQADSQVGGIMAISRHLGFPQDRHRMDSLNGNLQLNLINLSAKSGPSVNKNVPIVKWGKQP